ncbi:MAG: AMP-binding protein [Candidatus Melainabacteria bacterium]|nr:AMP-binding protein [Candidatus Melainabacteria bacterium]
MHLNQSLLRALSLFPTKEAIADGQKKMTYEELGKRIAALIAALKDAGVEKGDVVACMSLNCHEYLELYYATAFMGAVLNPLNYRLHAEEVRVILQDSNAKIFVGHTEFSEVIEKIFKNKTSVKQLLWLGPGAPQKNDINSTNYEPFLMNHWGVALPEPNATSDDLAQLYYTSGTTGQAKGVMLTHGNAAFNALAAVSELNIKDSDVWLHVAPIFHLVDAWAIWSVTWAGGKHVFLPQFKATPVMQVIEREGVTLTALVPTMLGTLLDSHNIWEYTYNTLRFILTAGSPIAPDMVRQVAEVFRCDYAQFYGMTETSPFLTISLPLAVHANLPAHKLLEVKAKTGRPIIGVDVKVVKEDGSEVAHNAEEVGEIIARGPNVTKGYWNKPDITAATIINGWLHTGDLATVDQDGFLNIVDRKKDMIVTGGENVFSTEVEHIIYEHGAVFECAVFGVPDEKWGEAVKAVIVCHGTMELRS